MFLIKLSWKNLTRHKRRTIITALALAFGLMMYILMDSLLIGILNQSNTVLIEAETGHGKIITNEAFDDLKFLPLSNRVKNPDKIMDIVESIGAKASKRISIHGEMIYTDEYFPKSGSTAILFVGIDRATDSNVFNVFDQKFLVEGRFMEEGADEVVLGSWLAEDVGADVGDWFTLAVRTASDGDDPGYFQTIDVEVVGIIKVESPMVNRRVVYFPLDMADYYLELNGDVTEVSVKMPFGDTLDSIKEKIDPKLPSGLEFYTWRALSPDYLALTEAKSGGSAVIIFLLVLIALVGITNTMLMTINERQKELGMMRALGMTDRNIRRSFIIEAAGIGIIGSTLGVIFGCLANIPMVNTGIDYSEMLRDADMGYRVSSIMKGMWNIKTIIIAFILGVIIPVVVSIAPTKKAIKKSIPDCINGR
ncbi:MAG: FtsX-like permease family protein [Spirochaetaceae bacterium]